MEGAATEWGIRFDWTFRPIEIVRSTEKTVFYIDHSWGSAKVRRGDKASVLDWRGSEQDARKLAERLQSAQAECHSRKRRADEWLKAEQERLIAKARGLSPSIPSARG